MFDSDTQLPTVVRYGSVKFGTHQLKCLVLDNHLRVFSARSIALFLGGVGGGAYRRLHLHSQFDLCLSAVNLQPFISQETRSLLRYRLPYRRYSRGSISYAYSIDTVIAMCQVWIQADQNHALLPNQLAVSLRARQLFQALLHIGLMAVINEATAPLS